MVILAAVFALGLANAVLSVVLFLMAKGNAPERFTLEDLEVVMEQGMKRLDDRQAKRSERQARTYSDGDDDLRDIGPAQPIEWPPKRRRNG